MQNPKSEYRNPKQTLRQKSQIGKSKNTEAVKLVLNLTYFGHLNLFRISDFVLRIFPGIPCAKRNALG